MNSEVKSQIERARELYQELKSECEKRMQEPSVHPRILNLAVEVLSKLRSILDHTGYVVFDFKISPKLSASEIKKTKVYFPISDDEQSFKSQLGRARLLDLQTESPATYKVLHEAQPFTSRIIIGLRYCATYQTKENIFNLSTKLGGLRSELQLQDMVGQ